MMFQCDKCGECCRNLDKYRELHDGDGICRYLRENLCSIYEKRPLICRIDEGFEAFFKDKISYEEYLQYTYECCEILKKL